MQTILLVDDEVDILDSLKPLLESALEDVHVATAESGDQALAWMRQHKPDLIISDYKMPGMNGLDFLEEAQRIAPGVPRMLITAFPDLDIALRAINEAAVENFITKPFKTDRVLEQVRGALFKRKVERLWKDSLAQSLTVLRSRQGAPP